MPVHVLGRPDRSGDSLSFAVLGRPGTAGSKKAIPIKRDGRFTGRVAVVDDYKKGKSWRESVRSAATDALADDAHAGPWFAGDALVLTVVFYLRRPKGHYGTGANARAVKPSAPKYPTTKPDTTKLVRAIEDALTGLAWRDDAQVVETVARKRFAHFGEPEHALVTIKEAT